MKMTTTRQQRTTAVKKAHVDSIEPYLDGTVPDDVMGVFDHSVAAYATLQGYRTTSFDINKINGGTDLLMWEGRSTVLRAIEQRRPKLLMAAPPCTVFTSFAIMWNLKKLPLDERMRREEEGQTMFDFATLCCSLQHTSARTFVLEQPVRATSWKRESARRLLLTKGVSKSTFDMCMYGLKAPQGQFMKKKTTFMSNQVKREFKVKCPGKQHGEHIVIQGVQSGQQLSKWAHNYPQPLCRAIMRATLEPSRCDWRSSLLRMGREK